MNNSWEGRQERNNLRDGSIPFVLDYEYIVAIYNNALNWKLIYKWTFSMKEISITEKEKETNERVLSSPL